MRMNDKSMSLAFWVEFFENLLSMGINQLHVSRDYESYKLLCAVLNELDKNNIKKKFNFTVKLPEPDFADLTFETERFQNKIENYLEDLKVDKIYNVQWMWRSGLEKDDIRINLFKKTLSRINKVVNNCKTNKKLQNFYCFPYSLDFAKSNSEIFDGYVVYYNPSETNFFHFMKNSSNKKRIITIRPFYGGKLVNKGKLSISDLLDFQFKHKFIDGIIYTCTKKNHIYELARYFND